MTEIGEYILSVAITALICGVISGIFKDSGLYKIIKLICNMMVMLSVLSPVANWTSHRNLLLTFPVMPDGRDTINDGIQTSVDTIAEVIKDKTEAYIVDKAAELGADITAKVTLTNDAPPVPAAVEIMGSISPYRKLKLEELIQEELNISKENQKWTG